MAATLLAKTSLALAQAPPPGGGGSGGGGGNQPTITWTYSGTKTIFNGQRTDIYPIQTASDMSANLQQYGIKQLTVNATATATVTWPQSATPPEFQWFALYLEADAKLINGAPGTLSATNGWSDPTTGTAGYTANSKGGHLVKRRVQNRQVQFTYNLVANAVGTSQGTGAALVSCVAGLALTERKLQVARADGGVVIENADGSYKALTTLSGPSLLPHIDNRNVQELTIQPIGAWSVSTIAPFDTSYKGVDLTLKTLYATAPNWENVNLYQPVPGSVSDLSMMQELAGILPFDFSCKDRSDGYKADVRWNWELHYKYEDWNQTGYEDWFKGVAQLSAIVIQSSATQQSMQVSFAGSYGLSHATTLTIGGQGALDWEIANASISGSLGQTDTATVTISASNTYTFNTLGIGQWVVVGGIAHGKYYGTHTVMSKLGHTTPLVNTVWDPCVELPSAFGLIVARWHPEIYYGADKKIEDWISPPEGGGNQP